MIIIHPVNVLLHTLAKTGVGNNGNEKNGNGKIKKKRVIPTSLD